MVVPKLEACITKLLFATSTRTGGGCSSNMSTVACRLSSTGLMCSPTPSIADSCLWGASGVGAGVGCKDGGLPRLLSRGALPAVVCASAAVAAPLPRPLPRPFPLPLPRRAVCPVVAASTAALAQFSSRHGRGRGLGHLRIVFCKPGQKPFMGGEQQRRTWSGWWFLRRHLRNQK